MKNETSVKDSVVEIIVNTREGRRIALVDAEDFDKIDVEDRYGIFKDRHGNALLRSGKESGQVFLHKLLVDLQRGSRLVHKNGNELDYRKENLQLVDKEDNVTELAPEKEQTQLDMAIEVLGVKGLEAHLQMQTPEVEDTAEREKSNIRGVYYHKHAKKWHASAFHSGKRYSLGYFEDMQKAESEVQLFRLHGPESPLLKRNQGK